MLHLRQTSKLYWTAGWRKELWIGTGKILDTKIVHRQGSPEREMKDTVNRTRDAVEELQEGKGAHEVDVGREPAGREAAAQNIDWKTHDPRRRAWSDHDPIQLLPLRAASARGPGRDLPARA
jgi:hypothetical protein